MKVPRKLYKYCPLGIHSLRAISEDEVHHTPPRNFNDPLDCNPTILIDLNNQQLIKLAKSMILEWHTKEYAEEWLEEILEENDKSPEFDKAEKEILLKERILIKIRELLDLDFGRKGVFSLSEKWDEPLLWSHYADQHRGICIEYDTSTTKTKKLGPVNYRAPRAMRANDLFQWKVYGNAAAQKRAYDGYFYSKADDWAYEKEWRDIADKAGVNPLPFTITAIYAGLKCDPVWIGLLKPLLKARNIRLHKITVSDHTFSISRELESKVDLAIANALLSSGKVTGDIFHSLPQSPNLTLLESIKSFSNLVPNSDSSLIKNLREISSSKIDN